MYDKFSFVRAIPEPAKIGLNRNRLSLWSKPNVLLIIAYIDFGRLSRCLSPSNVFIYDLVIIFFFFKFQREF